MSARVDIAAFAGGATDIRDGGPAGNALVSRPTGVACDDEYVYIADRGHNRVRQVHLATGIITTIAGTGPGDGGGLDGKRATNGDPGATRVRLRPLGLALAAGYLYVSEFEINRVHRIDLKARTIRVVAGNGDGGFSGDGGPAISAQLNTPRHMAATASHLYISDGGNHRVRRVDLMSGVISTIAGTGNGGYSGDSGPATAAQLRSPFAIRVLDDVLYVADSGNNRVRVVDLATGIITTLAGGRMQGPIGDGGPAIEARLLDPRGLALDESKALLFISEFSSDAKDASGARIRRIELATGIISTVAGIGTADFSGDGGPAQRACLNSPYGLAVDRGGRMLYVADVGNNRVRAVDLMHGVIHTLAGTVAPLGDDGPALAASLASPTQLAADPTGCFIFVCDSSNQRIRRVETATGTITTVAGSGLAGFGGDDGLALDARLNSPFGVACDARFLYISDRFNNRVRRVDLLSGAITTVAGTGTGGSHPDGDLGVKTPLWDPRGLALDHAKRHLYISQFVDERVRRLDLETGVMTTIAGTGVAGFSGDGGPATAAQLYNPTGVCVMDERLYIADRVNHRVRSVDRAGIITTVAGTGLGGFGGDGGPATEAQLKSPIDVQCDRAGNLYITDSGNHRVRRVDLRGVIATVAGTGDGGFEGDINTPFGCVLVRDTLYIAEFANHRVMRVTVPSGDS
jgi:DNA-binding beta-propeller fold protein YncE